MSSTGADHTPPAGRVAACMCHGASCVGCHIHTAVALPWASTATDGLTQSALAVDSVAAANQRPPGVRIGGPHDEAMPGRAHLPHGDRIAAVAQRDVTERADRRRDRRRQRDGLRPAPAAARRDLDDRLVVADELPQRNRVTAGVHRDPRRDDVVAVARGPRPPTGEPGASNGGRRGGRDRGGARAATRPGYPASSGVSSRPQTPRSPKRFPSATPDQPASGVPARPEDAKVLRRRAAARARARSPGCPRPASAWRGRSPGRACSPAG